MADLDGIVKKIGSFGFYQHRMCTLLGLMDSVVSFHMLVAVFSVAIPNHRCAIPDWSNDTYAIQSKAHEVYRNASIPIEVKDGKDQYSSCRVRDISAWRDDGWNEDYSNTTRTGCSRWVYDRSELIYTVTEKFSLVCDRTSLRTHAQMVFFAGVLVGAILLGLLSDIFGRKKILFFSLILMIGSGLGAVWAPDYYSYIFIRMIDGVATPGIMTNAFVLAVEFTEQRKRSFPGMLWTMCWSAGLAVLSGLAFAFRDWRHLHFVISAAVVPCFLFWWWIPESPRWLLSRNKLEAAERIFQEVARVNGVKLKGKLLDEKMLTVTVKTHSFVQNIRILATSKVMLIRAAVVFFNWMVVSISYYGLSLNMGNLSGNRYLNFFLMAVIEFPARFIGVILVDKMGRRMFHCLHMVFGGIACLATIFTVLYAKAYPWTTLALAIIGRCGAASAFFSVYLITSEVFPTVVRNGVMGTGSMCARVGAMISPYIADLSLFVEGPFSTALPLIVFGGSSVIAGLLMLIVPETWKQTLPQTIEDGKNFAINGKAPKMKGNMESSPDGIVAVMSESTRL